MWVNAVRSCSLLMQGCALFVAWPAQAVTAADQIYDFSLDEAEDRSSDAERHFTLSLRSRPAMASAARQAGRAVALRLARADANRWRIMAAEERGADGRLYACRGPADAGDWAAALHDGRTVETLPDVPDRAVAGDLVLICDLLPT